jgi:hypothetical protein
MVPAPSSSSRDARRREPAQEIGAPAGVAVRPVGRGRGLVALRAFAPGEVILQLEGRVTDRATRTSIQISEELHLDGPLPPPAGAAPAPSQPWQFLNHSCQPNSRIAAPRLLAVLPIAVGEEITFDYNTTEVDMAEPFPCACNSPRCRGEMVRGYAHLPEDERIRLAPFLSPHLRRLRPEGAAPAGRTPPG